MGGVTAAKCRGGLKHGVPYEATDLLGINPSSYRLFDEARPQSRGIHSPFPMFVDRQGCPGLTLP